MNMSEILITVGLTVLAGAVIAFLINWLESRRRRMRLLKVLWSEVEYNRNRLANFIEESEKLKSKEVSRIEAPLLSVEVYDAWRLSGEIRILAENVRQMLHDTHSLIVMNNIKVHEANLNYSKALGNEPERFRPRLDRIRENIDALENELDKGSDYKEEELLPRYIMLQA